MNRKCSLILLGLVLSGCEDPQSPANKDPGQSLGTVQLTAEQLEAAEKVENYRASVKAKIEAIPDSEFTPAKLPANYRPLIEASYLEIDGNLPFSKKVERHAEILDALAVAIKQVQANKEAAKRSSSLPDYLNAEENEKVINQYILPYAIAKGRADVLISDGYLAKNLEGSVCNAQGACADVDPITLLFFILAEKLANELSKDQPFGPNNDVNKLLLFLNRPIGGPNSDLAHIRDALLAYDTRGDIAKWVRDPGKSTVQVVQDARDKVIPPDSDFGRSDPGKVLRNPAVCIVNLGNC